MSDTDAIVAVYATHSETEKAIKWLQDGGVDMRHLSIVGKDYHTCDGASCQSADLKTGSRIRVTTKKDDRSTATGVESLNKHSEFPAAKS